MCETKLASNLLQILCNVLFSQGIGRNAVHYLCDQEKSYFIGH